MPPARTCGPCSRTSRRSRDGWQPEASCACPSLATFTSGWPTITPCEESTSQSKPSQTIQKSTYYDRLYSSIRQDRIRTYRWISPYCPLQNRDSASLTNRRRPYQDGAEDRN